MDYTFKFSKTNIEEKEKNIIEKDILNFVSNRKSFSTKDMEIYTRNRNYTFVMEDNTNHITVFVI
jgi:hypothetical protein